MGKGGNNGGIKVRNEMGAIGEIKGEIGARDMANISTSAKVRKMVEIIYINNKDKEFKFGDKLYELKLNGIISDYQKILLNKTYFMLYILVPQIVGDDTRLAKLFSKAIKMRVKNKKDIGIMIWMSLNNISPQIWTKPAIDLYNKLVGTLAKKLKKLIDENEHIIIVVDPNLSISIYYIKTDNIEVVKELLNMLKV